MQPGERLPRRVLPRRRRADGHEGALFDARSMGGGDRLLEPGREIECENPGSDLGGSPTEIRLPVQAGEDASAQIAQGPPEGLGGDHIPRGDRKAEGFEPGEIGGLAAQPRVRQDFSPRSAGEPDQQDSSSLSQSQSGADLTRLTKWQARGTCGAQDPCSPRVAVEFSCQRTSFPTAQQPFPTPDGTLQGRRHTFPAKNSPFSPADATRTPRQVPFPGLPHPQSSGKEAFPGHRAVRATENGMHVSLLVMHIRWHRVFPVSTTSQGGGNTSFPISFIPFPRGRAGQVLRNAL